MSDAKAPAPTVLSVWIMPGCTLCGQCETICPEAFEVRFTSSRLRDQADRFYRTHAMRILEAARQCPVKVIRVRTDQD